MATKEAKDETAYILVPRMRRRFSLKRANQKFERYVERLDSALGRMGKSPRDRLKWLLGFIECDLTSLRKDDWLNLQDDLEAFISEQGVVTGRGGSPLEQRLSQGKIKELKGEIRNLILAIIFRQGSYSFKLPELKHIIGRVRRQGQVGKIFHVVQGDLRSRILLAVVKLLEAEGHRLKKCPPECQKLFIAVKRQAYCSVRCSQRARTKRFFKEHSKDELSEKRHEAYRRRLEKERGRPTKVTRQKREQRQESSS